MMTKTLLVVLFLAAPVSDGADVAALASEPVAAPTATLDCAAMRGENPVQTEMRQLECALQRAVIAIGRDDLPAISHAIHVVHASKQKARQAIESGAWKPARGKVAAFVALDEAFHEELEALVAASRAADHAGASAALGRILGACQGCHAAFRPVAPAPTPWAAGSAMPEPTPGDAH